jgi:hypothetical protein
VIRALDEEQLRKEEGGICTTLDLVYPAGVGLPIDAPFPYALDAGWNVSASMHQGSCALPYFLADGGDRPRIFAQWGGGPGRTY